MKKTWIALILAALPVTSLADVVLYGDIKIGAEVTKEKGKSGTTTSIVDYGSTIGFRGSENLSDDVQVIWQLEQGVNIFGGDRDFADESQRSHRGFGSTNSFLGLKTPYGTVKAGYFYSGASYVIGGPDIWEYGSPAVGLYEFANGSEADRRRVNISYETPEVNGFSGSVFVAPSNNEQITRDGKNLNKKDSGVYGFTASYAKNGFYLDAGVTVIRNVIDEKAHGKKGYDAVVQGIYDGDKLFAGLTYHNYKGVGEVSYKGQEVAGSLSYKLTDALKVKGSAGYGFDFKNSDGSRADVEKYYQGIVGADYALSKRTVLNAQVGHLVKHMTADKDRTTTLTFGMAHSF